MPLLPPSEIRSVTGVSAEQIVQMRSFLQGAVYCWVKNRSDEQFALRDLVGGENFEWSGTPLYPLFEKHSLQGKNDPSAVAAAAKDAGWLLKAVLNDDKGTFIVGDAGLANGYRWVGNEP
ncbi:MAG: hypothetical protein IPK32_22655 [Verrucomicrobiaceae bacterium]|nr:hypothetical protein [Verrucomicrobiaceae bacterium]